MAQYNFNWSETVLLIDLVFEGRAKWLAGKGACDPGFECVLDEYNEVLEQLWEGKEYMDGMSKAFSDLGRLYQEQEHARRIAAGLPLKKEGEIYA